MTVSQKYLCVRNLKTLDGARTEILARKTDSSGKEWVIERLGGMSGEVFGRDVKVIDGQGGTLIPALTDLCSYPDRARTAGGLKEESTLAAKSGFSRIVEFDPPTGQSGKESFLRRAFAAHCRIPFLQRLPENPEEGIKWLTRSAEGGDARRAELQQHYLHHRCRGGCARLYRGEYRYLDFHGPGGREGH